jgi:hypothetical protein
MSNEIGVRTSRITVAWNQLTFFLAYSVVLAAVGAVLVARTRYEVIGVVMIVSAVAVLVSKVARGSGQAACPTCGKTLADLQRGAANPSVLCAGCGKFHEGEGGVMRQVAPDRVAATPLFPARMPATIVWPSGCPVCGAPTVREVEAKVMQVHAGASLAASAANPVANVITGSTTHVSVPHCAAHDDGVKLQGFVGGGAVDLVFRSYPFQRAFCEANKVGAAELITAWRTPSAMARFAPRA